MFGLVVAVCAAGVRAVCFQLKGRWYEIGTVDVHAWCLATMASPASAQNASNPYDAAKHYASNLIIRWYRR